MLKPDRRADLTTPGGVPVECRDFSVTSQPLKRLEERAEKGGKAEKRGERAENGGGISDGEGRE